jgi:hypothetical protein
MIKSSRSSFNRIGWGPYIGSKAPSQGRLEVISDAISRETVPGQAASILFTSLTSSRR